VSYLLNTGRGFTFKRVVRHASGETFDVAGRATWSEAPAGALESTTTLSFEEAGELSLAGSRAPPSRVRAAYTWCVSPGGALRVLFPDARLFFELDAAPAPGREPARVAHSCAPDAYAGELSLSAAEPPALRVVWRVSGPSKDYVSDTTYTPTA